MAEQVTQSKTMMAIFWPDEAFNELSKTEISPREIFFKYTVWLLILPPLFLFIGGKSFGWHIGASDPLSLPTATLVIVSIGYFLALLFGFFSTVTISRWMAKTYSARTSMSVHIALVSIVGAPLAIVSVIHLFPHIMVNLLFFLPAIIWSMYLLYTGLPVVLKTTPEKGMLMASSLVGWLLVAAVSLLCLSLGLWAIGLGPFLGV